MPTRQVITFEVLRVLFAGVAAIVERAAAHGLLPLVGRVEQPLTPPSRPWEFATVAFEIARRHRFTETLAALPLGVEVHVLPSGLDAASAAGLAGLSQRRHRDTSHVAERIDAAYLATSAYLDDVLRRTGEDVLGQHGGR